MQSNWPQIGEIVWFLCDCMAIPQSFVESLPKVWYILFLVFHPVSLWSIISTSLKFAVFLLTLWWHQISISIYSFIFAGWLITAALSILSLIKQLFGRHYIYSSILKPYTWHMIISCSSQLSWWHFIRLIYHGICRMFRSQTYHIICSI